MDDLVFDARLDKALKLKKESFDTVCGVKGLKQIGEIIRFRFPYGIPKKLIKPNREMKSNWNDYGNK